MAASQGVIRAASEGDVPALGAIERAAGGLFPPGRIPDPDHSYPSALLEQAVKEALLFVVEVEGQVVGFATCTVIRGRLHLEELAVHPEHGRQGFGRRLVETVIGAADDRGLLGVSLTTFSDIPWNGPFYASMGFETLAETELDQQLTGVLAKEREVGLTQRIAMFRSNR